MIAYKIMAFIVIVITACITADTNRRVREMAAEKPEIEVPVVQAAPTKIMTTVTATVYNPVPGQTDDTPLITASGFHINEADPESDRICALSRDLLARWGGEFDYGDNIVVTGAGRFDGVWTVEDTMAARFKHYIDFCTNQTRGKWTNVKIIKEKE